MPCLSGKGVKMSSCDCRYDPFFIPGGVYAGGEILYCPKHAAAPDLFEAATGLVNSLPDNVIDWARDGIGNSNAGAIIHWRDRVKATLELAGDSESDETK